MKRIAKVLPDLEVTVAPSFAPSFARSFAPRFAHIPVMFGVDAGINEAQKLVRKSLILGAHSFQLS